MGGLIVLSSACFLLPFSLSFPALLPVPFPHHVPAPLKMGSLERALACFPQRQSCWVAPSIQFYSSPAGAHTLFPAVLLHWQCGYHFCPCDLSSKPAIHPPINSLNMFLVSQIFVKANPTDNETQKGHKNWKKNILQTQPWNQHGRHLCACTGSCSRKGTVVC